MHHGTCVTHVPWCMSGSLTCGDEENVPGIPGACAPAILCIWQEAHGACIVYACTIITSDIIWANVVCFTCTTLNKVYFILTYSNIERRSTQNFRWWATGLWLWIMWEKWAPNVANALQNEGWFNILLEGDRWIHLKNGSVMPKMFPCDAVVMHC